MDIFLLGVGGVGLILFALLIEFIVIVIGVGIIDIEILDKWWGWIIGFFIGNTLIAITIGVIYFVGNILDKLMG